MLASDINNPNFLGATDPDARLAVTFYKKPLQNKFLSEVEGRPIFEDIVFIKIQIPSDNTFDIDVPAQDHHKNRFPLHWARFTNNNDEKQVIGTPLSQWPLLSAAIVEELKYQKFTTVEQIAGSSDQQISRMGMSGGMAPYALREQAKRYLEVARGVQDLNTREEELQKLRDENIKIKAAHTTEMDDMKQQIAELMQLFQEQSKEPMKRGRKPIKAIEE